MRDSVGNTGDIKAISEYGECQMFISIELNKMELKKHMNIDFNRKEGEDFCA